MSYDKDRKYMAARDLFNFLSSGLEIADSTKRDLLNAFAKHLCDPYIEVRRNALNLLPAMVPYLSEVQISMVYGF